MVGEHLVIGPFTNSFGHWAVPNRSTLSFPPLRSPPLPSPPPKEAQPQNWAFLGHRFVDYICTCTWDKSIVLLRTSQGTL